MTRDPEQCMSGLCRDRAAVRIRFVDGWLGRFCRRCAKKIAAPPEVVSELHV